MSQEKKKHHRFLEIRAPVVDIQGPRALLELVVQIQAYLENPIFEAAGWIKVTYPPPKRTASLHLSYGCLEDLKFPFGAN